MHRVKVVACAALAFIPAYPLLADISPGGYTIIDIGPGSFSGTPAAPSINEAGEVTLGANSPAAVWRNGVLTPLVGPADTHAYFINNRGEVVGGRGGTGAPVGWFLGGYSEFGAGVPGTGDLASDVNDHGDVTVTSSEGGFVYRNGTATPTGLRRAEGINNSGVVVGTFRTSTTSVAAHSIGGVVSILENVPSNSTALDINSGNMIVGSFTSSGSVRPFLWSDGDADFLPLLHPNASNYAVAINDPGDVVGYTLSGVGDAVFWSGDDVYNLQDHLTNGQGWDLVAATGINAAGQIVGSGMFNGESRIFLLNPVPTPGAATIVTGAIVMLVRRRRA